MNIDAQPVLGPLVLSSALTDWSQVYSGVIRMKLNGALGNKSCYTFPIVLKTVLTKL